MKLNRLSLWIFLVLALLISFALMSTFSSASTENLANFQITNIRENTFTASWTTLTAMTGEIYYGENPDNLSQVANDMRGDNYKDEIHYITVTALNPDTTYYFDIHSGGNVDDNGGKHYEVTTGPILGAPSPDTPSYGQLYKADGITTVEQCIVYIYLSDNDSEGSPGVASPLSSLVETGESGYWDSVLSNARLSDLSAYFSYSSPGDNLEVKAWCGSEGTADQTIDIGYSSPAPHMVLETAPSTKLYLPFTVKD